MSMLRHYVILGHITTHPSSLQESENEKKGRASPRVEAFRGKRWFEVRKEGKKRRASTNGHFTGVFQIYFKAWRLTDWDPRVTGGHKFDGKLYLIRGKGGEEGR